MKKQSTILVNEFKRLIPYRIRKLADIVLQTINPVFIFRMIKSMKECIQLIAKRRVEFKKFEESDGLSAIFYFTGDISIFINEDRIDEIEQPVVDKFLSELEKVSHTISRFPSVLLTWLGQLGALSTYFQWDSIINIIKNIQGMI